jgi:hypothetical protein
VETARRGKPPQQTLDQAQIMAFFGLALLIGIGPHLVLVAGEAHRSAWTRVVRREIAMPLEIQPVRAVYDDTRDIVTFMGLDSSRLVRCSVTREALFELARRRAESAGEMLVAYHSCSDRIHRAAVRKYEKHQLNDDGSVLVQRSDVESED